MQINNEQLTNFRNSQTDPIRAQLQDYLEQLKQDYHSNSYNKPESFIHLPNDPQIIKDIENIHIQFKNDQLDYIYIIGIGGSYLGAKAVYDALIGYTDIYHPNQTPKLIFLDTCNSTQLNSVFPIITLYQNNPEKLLFILISKSGTTMESLVNYELISTVFPNLLDRTIVISSKDTPLEKWALAKSLPYSAQPAQVGGRYSIFSVTGLLPLPFHNINISDLIKGARDLSDSFFADPFGHAIYESTLLLFLNYNSGHLLHELFFFNSELETLGKWYRQLLAESLGKRINNNPNQQVGITPTISIGSTDLHSIEQLTLGGPNRVFTTFITAPHSSQINLPAELILGYEPNHIKGKSIHQIMDSIYQGVLMSRKHHNIPYNEIKLSDITEYELGQLMQSFMLETILLAKLLNVNAFDQPNVELYKEKTREILSKL